MNKIISTSIALLLTFVINAQDDGNYVIIINNDSISINLNNKISYTTESGDKLDISIEQPEILTYKDDMISFQHDKSLSVSNNEIERGIEQCMIVSSTGNGFIVQKYKTFNPTSLIDLMLNELIKENISYGYSKTEKDFEKKLKSGETIKGTEVTMTYRGETETYTVAAYGGKDEGILVVTMLLTEEDFPEDVKIIDLFLNTLTIN